jgi:hypothetical protein
MIPKDIESFTALSKSSFLRQLGVMMKISFVQKFHASTIWIEICPPLLFFLFACLFVNRARLWSDSLPSPATDQYIPFNTVPGPIPQYAFVPDNPATHLLLQAVQEVLMQPKSATHILESSKFFG